MPAPQKASMKLTSLIFTLMAHRISTSTIRIAALRASSSNIVLARNNIARLLFQHLEALVIGQLRAEQLAALADLAEQQGDGTLRLTPWRALLLPGVEDAAPAASLGLILAPEDPRLRIAACTGAPGCGSAFIDTRAAAAQVAAVGLPGLLHLSGCAKGCAHPGTAPATLVGGPDGYAIIRDGRAGDRPAAAGLTLEQALAVLQRP